MKYYLDTDAAPMKLHKWNIWLIIPINIIYSFYSIYQWHGYRPLFAGSPGSLLAFWYIFYILSIVSAFLWIISLCGLGMRTRWAFKWYAGLWALVILNNSVVLFWGFSADVLTKVIYNIIHAAIAYNYYKRRRALFELGLPKGHVSFRESTYVTIENYTQDMQVTFASTPPSHLLERPFFESNPAPEPSASSSSPEEPPELPPAPIPTKVKVSRVSTAPTPPPEAPTYDSPPEPPVRPERRHPWPIPAIVSCTLFAIAAIILGILLWKTTAINTAYAAHAAELQNQISSLKVALESSTDLANAKMSQLNDATRELSALNDKYDHALAYIEDLDYYYWFMHTQIGFVLSSDTQYYHMHGCPTISSSEYLFIYNTSFCEGLHLIKCPSCWPTWDGRPYSYLPKLQ